MWWGTHVDGFRDRLRESGSALADVFRNPGLRRLQLAFIGSIVGDRAFTVAVAVYAYAQGGPTAVGVVGVARYLSMAVAFPIASTLADRHSRKLVMALSDLVCATLALTGAVVIAVDGPPVLVYALVIGTSVAATCFRPAQAALLPTLARNPRELTAANVAASTFDSVGMFAGPALGGILLAVTNIQTVFIVNGISFLWSMLFVLGLPSGKVAAQETREAPEAEGFVRHASAGFRVILGDRNLRLLIGLFCAQCVVAGASAVFIVTIGLDLLDIGQAGVGYLDAVVGIGGLVGGLVALVLAQRGRLAFDFGVGVLLWSLPLIAIAVWPTVAVAALAMVLIGFGNSLVDINAFTIVQRAVPDAVMGRVFGALESALIAAMALGALSDAAPDRNRRTAHWPDRHRCGHGRARGRRHRGLNRVDRTVLAPEGLELLRAHRHLPPAARADHRAAGPRPDSDRRRHGRAS